MRVQWLDLCLKPITIDFALPIIVDSWAKGRHRAQQFIPPLCSANGLSKAMAGRVLQTKTGNRKFVSMAPLSPLTIRRR
jgi:hypothetical protein